MRAPPLCAATALAVALAACSSKNAESGNAVGGAQTGAASVVAAEAIPSSAAQGAAPTAATPDVKCSDYRSDVENGDMVMIYHAVSGITPAFDKWAESILYKFDRSIDPEGAWKKANEQIQAQYAAVAQTRCITLRTDAGIRAYDSARGGLIVGSFSPDTYYPFRDFGEDVRLRIRNAEAAAIWKLPADRAEALMRGSYNFGGASVVARLKIVSARPSSGNGVIEADVQSYDIMPNGNGAKIATVEVVGAP